MHTPGLPVLVDAKRFIVKCAVDKLGVPTRTGTRTGTRGGQLSSSDQNR